MALADLPTRAVIVCDCACSIEFRNGLFIVDDPAMPFVRGYTPEAFFVGFQSAAQAIQEYHGLALDCGVVVPFKAAV